MSFKRMIVIVLDGVGAGEAPDAADYGDSGSNSLSHTAEKVGGLSLPNLERLGFGHITPMKGVKPVQPAAGAYGRLQPKSAGKDSVTGHWELMGIYLTEPFPTYPNGFPKEVLDAFKRETGYEVLANRPASGTEVIQEYGEEHLRTGQPIVYTSADSVFQIAAHEDVIPISRLYEICEISRKILTGRHHVGRVIARPFTGTGKGNFVRTSRRRDYPRIPDRPTMLEEVIASGRKVYATGKIDDLFGHRGISVSNHTTNNRDSTLAMIQFLREDFEGMLIANLIEFDMIFGHRNDVSGYAGALEAFDQFMPEIVANLNNDDVAMIVADHGVDPTTTSTDHSREYSPLLVFGKNIHTNVSLGDRASFADVAATIAENFQLPMPEIGMSFLKEILP